MITIPEAVSRESDAARFYLFEAVTSLFRHAALVQPLLLVIDDLHAADESSRLLLEFLVLRLRGARLLVVATYCDSAMECPARIGDLVGPLVREGQLVRLSGLARDDVKDLIEVPSGAVPSHAPVAVVHQRTEGNPLFVREVVRLQAAEATLGRPPGTAGMSIPVR